MTTRNSAFAAPILYYSLAMYALQPLHPLCFHPATRSLGEGGFLDAGFLFLVSGFWFLVSIQIPASSIQYPASSPTPFRDFRAFRSSPSPVSSLRSHVSSLRSHVSSPRSQVSSLTPPSLLKTHGGNLRGHFERSSPQENNVEKSLPSPIKWRPLDFARGDGRHSATDYTFV